MSDTISNVTYGFYNSVGGDRKYNAEDFGMLFDGLITDGVFSTIGEGMTASISTNPDKPNTIKIGTGKCWFNHTWTWVHEPIYIGYETAETLQNRYDAIVVEVNANTRVNTIYCIKGTPATVAQYPTLTRGMDVNQYPLCYIYRPSGSGFTVDPKNIKNMVGTDDTPVVAATVPTIKVENFVNQWNAQFEAFMTGNENVFDTFIEDKDADWDTYKSGKDSDWDTYKSGKDSDWTKYKDGKNTEYYEWFNPVKETINTLPDDAEQWYLDTINTVSGYLSDIQEELATDQAHALQLQITKNEIRSALMNGLTDGSKVISEDGSVITSKSADETLTLTKTFTNEFSTSTTVLTDNNGTELGKLVKNISSDGRTITSEITINSLFD